jgi:hypothetical protein
MLGPEAVQAMNDLPARLFTNFLEFHYNVSSLSERVYSPVL